MMEPADRDQPLPPYTFVPGGPWPHPLSDPAGHSAGTPRAPVTPIAGDDWRHAPAYLRGIALFNAGYYWEAHEAWEPLWHAHGRQGPTADLLKALIKLAAAGVKVRQRQPHGVFTHARRAAEHFARARAQGGRHQLGLDLDAWIAIAEQVAQAPPADVPPPGAAVAPVFPFRIEPC